jgi:hypothetical protein
LSDAGFKSIQRLVLADDHGGVVVAMMPGELKPNAEYLYMGQRAKAFVGSAADDGWDVHANPHLAFFQAPPHQRLYLEPSIDVEGYVELFEGPGWERVGAYSERDLIDVAWPWLKENGCATPEDDLVFGDFVRLLGSRRQAHLRPALHARRTWTREEVSSRSQAGLASEIRAAVNRLLEALGEPNFPVN